MHWRRSKCEENEKLQQLSTIAENMYSHSKSLNVNDSSDNQLAVAMANDNCIIADLEFDCNNNPEGNLQHEMDLGHMLHYQVPSNNSQKQLSKTVNESRAAEFMLEGLEHVFDETVVEDDWIAETESNLNVGFNIEGDVFTIQSEEPFFPLPLINQHVTVMQQEQLATANEMVATGTAVTVPNETGTIYAPISMFKFKRVFTSEEYFMIKLCQICDKANVPHHIVDDVVDLLRECKQNNIKVQPELLRKRVHF